MSYEVTVTVTGYVATEPRLIVSRNGTEITTFRLASTPRRYDRAAESWVDGATQWFSVKSFRRCAANISASLRKGDPVVVMGRLTSAEWEKDGQHYQSNEIEALALGHDLMLGRTSFLKVAYEKKEEEPREGEGSGEVNGEDLDGSELDDDALAAVSKAFELDRDDDDLDEDFEESDAMAVGA